jgi:hypothetical protein
MSLWGNKDLVYNEGTVQVNLGTSTAQVTGTVGVVTFTTSGISTGNVITIGAGATYGYAVITGFTSTTLSIASTAGIVTGITTVPSTTYFVSEEPVYTLGDSIYRAPESKTVGYSTSPVFTGVFGVSAEEVGAAATITVGGKASAYAVSHSGWVGVTTYIDTHGNLRVKSEVLVAGGIDSTAGTDADDDTIFPDPTITIVTDVADAVGVATDGDATFTVVASVFPTYSPLTYQWYEDTTALSNGGDYSGATTSVLTVANDSDKDDGREYSVVIASGDTSVTSGVGTITYA